MENTMEFIKGLKEFQDLIKEKKSNNLTHSYMLISKDNYLLQLFSKALAGLILCKDNLCTTCTHCQKVIADSHPDIFIYPKDKDIKKDDINDIREHLAYKPFEADGKVFLLDKFSTANDTSQNKLLKSLENPPQNTYFILCVNNEIPVLPTIFSRCKKIYLQPLSEDKIEDFIRPIAQNANTKNIASIAGGSLDKAVNLVQNNSYMQSYDVVLEVLERLNKSSTMLPLCAKMYAKAQSLEEILEIMESVLEDVLYIRLNRQNLITNKHLKDRLIAIAEKYSADCVDLIIKKIYEIRKQIDFNCARNGLIDNLLLYILEVKYLCK